MPSPARIRTASHIPTRGRRFAQAPLRGRLVYRPVERVDVTGQSRVVRSRSRPRSQLPFAISIFEPRKQIVRQSLGEKSLAFFFANFSSVPWSIVVVKGQ